MLTKAVVISGCASSPAAPQYLARINAEINSRATYRYYEAKDFRYLKPGVKDQEGNCAAFAGTKLLDLNRAGYSPVLRECTLPQVSRTSSSK
jgi:hypothetical protein